MVLHKMNKKYAPKNLCFLQQAIPLRNIRPTKRVENLPNRVEFDKRSCDERRPNPKTKPLKVDLPKSAQLETIMRVYSIFIQSGRLKHDQPAKQNGQNDWEQKRTTIHA